MPRQTYSRYSGELYPGDILAFGDGIYAWIRPRTEEHSPVEGEVTVEWLIRAGIGYATSNVSAAILRSLHDSQAFSVVAEAVRTERAAELLLEDILKAESVPEERRANVGTAVRTLTPAPRRPPNQLCCRRLRSKTRVQSFLDHPLVDHKLGNIDFWWAVFGAVYPEAPEKICAVAVLDRPARVLDDGTRIQLSRFAATHQGQAAARHKQSHHIGSWLLSHAATWARLEGFDELITYSGVDDNDGTLYEAADFVVDETDLTHCGDGWQTRDGRDSWTNSRARTRWRRDLHEATSSSAVKRRATARDGQLTLTCRTSPSKTAGVQDLALTREAAPERAHGRAADLFSSHGKTVLESPLGTYQKDIEAIFGGDFRGELQCAIACQRPSDERYLSSRNRLKVVGYAARDTRFPVQTAQWLLARVRSWARYEGYAVVECPVELFPSKQSITGLHTRDSSRTPTIQILPTPQIDTLESQSRKTGGVRTNLN